MVVSDNDAYTSTYDDGYYTNGIKLSYKWNPRKNDSTGKSITNHIEIGQNIYNSKDGLSFLLKDIDRPVTGYLYGNFQKTVFSKKQNVLRWGIEAGSIGKIAFGNEVQNFIHNVLDVGHISQWKYQLHPGWGLTGTIIWSPQIIHNKEVKRFDFKPIIGASLGNMFTNAVVGAAFLIGKFNNNSTSDFWGNHFSHNKKGREYFLSIHPALYLQGYNATVQGNVFNKTPEIVNGKLNPLLFQCKAGLTYATKKYSLAYFGIYEGKQSLTQKATQFYASIQLSYRW